MAETNPLNDVIDLVQRADRYDDEARIALLEFGAGTPEDWAQVQTIVTQVEAGLVKLAAGDDPVLAVEIIAVLARLRIHLAGQEPIAIERAIPSLLALRWLQWRHATSLCQRHQGSSWRLRKRLRGRESHCRRRYQVGLKTLAKLRCVLALPVNVDRCFRLG